MLLNLCGEFVASLLPLARALKARVLRQLRRADGAAEASVKRVVAGLDIEHAVLGVERPRRYVTRVEILRLWRDLLRHEPARRLEIHHANIGLQQRGMYPLPLT